MMKKIILMLFLIGMVVSANAGLTVVVKVEDGPWMEYPDSELWIAPSTNLEWGVRNDGLTDAGTYALGLSGVGILSGNIDVLASGVTAEMADNALQADSLGVQNPFILMTLDGGSSLEVLCETEFHCEGSGDVVLYVFDNDTGAPLDSQIIHQIPEPVTLALLGLGSLFLRRRRIA